MVFPCALAISATDPGGSLLAADLLAFDTLGVVGSGVVTATTAHGLRRPGPVHDVPVAAVRASLEASLQSRPPSAVKVGVLTTVPAARAVARALAGGAAPVVLDPGFAPASGVRLLRSSVLETLVHDLLPGAALVTLNLLEASALAGFAIRGEPDAKAAARRIQALGPGAVLVTGGCADGPTVVDGLLDGRTWHRFEAPRSDVPPACGAGGLLSAAVTAWLAAGETLPDAVARGLTFVHRALAAGWGAGSGLHTTLYGAP
jgi:hydroxymethylpyrimidine/phosphomethylpyrimidine kinase